MSRTWLLLPIAVAALTTACASVPTGPSVMVLPGSTKSFEQFQSDDGSCRQWGFQQAGIAPEHAATSSVISGATIGTLLGAAAGAAIGAAAGGPATGAAVGAGFGLFSGTAIGTSYGAAAGYSVQNRFDNAYVQCMYAKGHQVPVARGSQPYAASAPSHAVSAPPPPPPPGSPPPPPAGAPPPPPPDTR
jgi:OmpA family protein